MPRSILETESTTCGICGLPAILATGAGTRAMLELEPSGAKVPHFCPVEDAENWIRHARRQIRMLQFRIISARSDQSGSGPDA